jgi:hypothetical protein
MGGSLVPSSLIGAERRPQTAAALDEVIRVRDTGSIQAVRAYEARYGVLVEKPSDWAFPHEDVTQAEFERVWADARRSLTARWYRSIRPRSSALRWTV